MNAAAFLIGFFWPELRLLSRLRHRKQEDRRCFN